MSNPILGFSPELNLLGNFAFIPQILVSCPFFRNVKLPIDQYSLVSMGISEYHSHLAILNFSQSAAILPLYSYRAISLFGKSRFINVQRPIDRISDQFADFLLKFIDQDSLIPWRMRYKMLQRLIGAFADFLCEPAAIASFSIKKQALQIFPRIAAAISGASLECIIEVHSYQSKY
jgi:hypothetical protein